MIGSPEHSGAWVVGLSLPEQTSKKLLSSSQARLSDHLKSNDSRKLIKGPETGKECWNQDMNTFTFLELSCYFYL